MAKGASSGISFSEYVSRRNSTNGYGKDDEKKKKKAGLGASSGISFGEYMADKNDSSYSIDADGVDSWFKSASDLSSSFQQGDTSKFTTEYGKEYKDTIKSLMDQSTEVRRYLRDHKDEVKDYDSVYDSYAQFNQYLRSLDSHINDVNKYYSQFDSEEHYQALNMSLGELYTKYLRGEDSEEGSVAFTTKDGQNVTWKNLYELKKAEAEYDQLSAKPDWDEKSAGLGSTAITFGDGSLSDEDIIFEISRTGMPHKLEYALEDGYTEEQFKDVQAKREYISKKYGVDVTTTDNLYDQVEELGKTGNMFWYMDDMTDEEKSVFSYIYNTQGWEAANDWLTPKMAAIEQRKAYRIGTELEDDSPLLANALSVVASLASGIEYVSDGVDYLATGNEQTNALATASSAIRGATSENIESDFWKFMYNTGMSGVDSLAASALPGGTILLAGSAAAHGYNDAIARGLSAEDAYFTGFRNGVNEYIFERFSMGNFKALKDSLASGGKAIAKNLAKTMFVNASEETATEIANIVSDRIFNADLSQVATTYRQYLANGIAPEEAKALVKKDINAQIFEAGLSGAVMGLGFGVIGNAYGAYNYNQAALAEGGRVLSNEGVDGLKILADEMAGVTNAKDLSKLAGKVDSSQSRRNVKNVGKLSIEVDSARVEQNRSDITNALVEKGVSKVKANQYADVLIEMNDEFYNGNADSFTLGTDKQWKKITGDPNAYSVLSSIVTDKSSSVNMRNRQHNLGRMGIKMNEDGTADISDIVEKEVLKENYAKQSEGIKAEVADDGKTKVISTDTEVTLKGIDHIETKKVGGKTNYVGYVKVSDADGNESVVDIANVKFGSRNEAVLYEAFVGMDIDPAYFDAFVKNFNEADFDGSIGEAAMQYATGFVNAFRYGWANLETELGDNVYASKLTESVRNTAYTLGTESVSKETEAKQEAKDTAVAERKASGEGKARTQGKLNMDAVKTKKRTAMQNAGVGLAKRLTSLGIDVYIYESQQNAKGEWVDDRGKPADNGFYRSSDGSIHIDLNAGNNGQGIMVYTLSHELVHFMRDQSPKEFKILADLLVKWYGKKGQSVSDLIHQRMNDENLSWDEAYEEVIARSCESFLTDSNIADRIIELQQTDKKTWETIRDKVLEFLKWMKSLFANVNPESYEGDLLHQYKSEIDHLYDAFYNTLADAVETNQWVGSIAEAKTNVETLATAGITVDANTGSAVMNSVRYAPKTQAEIDKVAKALSESMGVSIEKAKAWVKSETSLASVILDPSNAMFLDYEADDRYEAIKKNAEYPQGTVDFSNLCKKRREFTALLDKLQKEHPNRIITAEEMEKIRQILIEENVEVACGLCYVEERRQLLGEIAQGFIDGYKNGTLKEAIAKELDGNDSYVPTIYDLITYDGYRALTTEHPSIAKAFQKFNNARGMQAGRLIEGIAEYKRDILNWSQKKVDFVNSVGGLRVFSFSDFEATHLIDLVQVVQDCAAKGVMIQAYTKVPAFANAVKDTNMKVNRSLIAKGTGIKYENGRMVLDLDPVEGIDINDKDFFDSTNSENVGNVLVGMSNEQIRLAMKTPFVDYIIPFHTSLKGEILGAKKIDHWDNYKNFQTDKEFHPEKVTYKKDGSIKSDGWVVAENQINVYVDVIQAAEADGKPIKNKVDFVNKFLAVAKEKGLKPRFWQFLDVDANGEYVYTEGYHKFLVDFKLFDQQGNILPQKPVVPVFDDALNSRILSEYVAGKKAPVSRDAVYDRLENEVINGEGIKKSSRGKSQSNGYGTIREIMAKQGLDEWSEKLGSHFPLSAAFDETMRGDKTPLVMETITAQSVARAKKDSAFTIGRNAFRSTYGVKTSVHINQLNIDADLYANIASESISKAIGKSDEQVLLDVIPHYKDILANSVFLAVERVAHTQGKGTALYGYRLYNLYWYEENGKKTPHCLVSTVVQNTDSAEGYVFRDIENVTIEQGLLGNKADMSPPLDSDNYTIAQLYKFVKRLSRDEGGLKYSPEEQAKYGFSYKERNDGVKYSKRQKAPTFYSYMGVVVDGVKQEKLGAASVINLLKGKGVKDEEIKWSGIEAWLEGKRSVTKAELQEFIAGSQLQIEEDTLDNKDRPYTDEQQKRLDEYEAKRDEVAKRLADEWKRITGDDFPVRNAGAGLESAVTNAIIDANLDKKNASFEGRLMKKLRKDLYEVIERNDDFGFDSAKDALRSIHRHRRDFISYYEMSANDKAVIVKYCNALNAYNELPNSISDEDTDKLRVIAMEADPWNRKIMEVKHEHNEEEARYMTKWGQYRIEGGKNYREVLFRIPDSTYSNSAMYAHWEERRGVLAHARVQDFVDADGNRMLFVEELQSDWHNEGHKSGYRDPGVEDKHTLSKKMDKFREEFFESSIAKVFEEKISAVGYEGAGVSMMLNYLLDETDYTLDVLRRKGVSFTNDEKSEIDRYVREYGELSKQWEDAPGDLTAPDAPFKETYHEFVLKRLLRMAAEEGYDSIGWTTAGIQMDRWNPNRKTNREMGIEDAKNPDAIAFEDGYRIEYDQDIPKFLRKYGKKWGAEVGTTTLDNGTEVWTMSVTDSMKDSVLYEGQVMYQRRGTGMSNRSILANALESATQHESEARRLAEYKEKIDLINAEEQKLYETRARIAELSFASGPKDTTAIKNLQDTATRIANRINTYDKQLLNLEATAPLKALLAREKEMVRKREKAKANEELAKYREKSAETLREVMNRNTKARERYFEGRKKTEAKHKIKDYKAKLERTLLNPTDRQYVPVDLIKAMVDVCDLIDTDTPLYKEDGELNKAQAKRNLTKERLQALKDEYENLKTNSDPVYAGEFDDVVYEYLKDLRDKFGGKNLNDMSLDELNEMYYTLRAISDTLQDARKLIGREDMGTVYEVGDAIVSEQNAITAKRKKGKRSSAQKAADWTINQSLSPVRNVERMSGYNKDSYLRELFSEFEIGIRRKNKFVMESYKSFERLTSGKEYEDAVYKEYGKEYVDINGRKFYVSKMQMMQAILSHDREVANHMNHIQSGGFTFADLDMLRKGKLKDAISEEYSHRVPSAVEMVGEFREALKDDKWCQEYMQVAREFFDGKAKDAINETSIALKHRIIARDKSYIPFEVDKNFVVREISAENDIQQTINSYGMLKSKKDGAPQAIIITGLNNILDRHIEQVGSVHGLAIPVRNFNKVWNVRSLDIAGNDPTVKTAIQRNWGVGGVEHIEQAVQDIQGSRPDNQSAIYKFVKSGYISSTFTFNLSVVTKQIGSLFSATSMLRWRDPVRMLGNLMYTMANHKKISAEVDKYTASAWMRRQGMSDAELHTLTTMAKKPGLLRAMSKAPAVINPVKWITAMDHAVALSLWRYAKIDTAKKTGLKGEELLQATAAFYDDVIENTQSMSDVLHRPEIQKRGDVMSEAFGMFKTDLYQMAGQLQTAAGRYGANKTKENGQALTRTAYSVLMSALWGQLMTSVWALFRYKVKPYRDDEDEELTAKSWLERQQWSFYGDLAGYAVPLFGSELVGAFENIKYGESDDIVDSLALTAINDLYDVMITVASSVKDGEMPEPEQMKKLTIKALQLFKIPANNILRTYDAIKLHAEDIANGEFLSFEAGAERTPKHNIHRIIEAVDSGDYSEASSLLDEIVEDMAMDAADGEYGEDELNEAKSKLKTALGEKYKDGEVDEDTVKNILSKLFGMDDDDIYWTFDKWGFAIDNGSSDDYAKYDAFISAVKSGGNVSAEIKRYTDNGVEMDSLKTALGNAYKEDELSKSSIENVLSRHFDLEDDDIYWQFDRWDYAKQNGTSEGYSKYAEFITAVESGRNLKTTIKRYTGHGVDAKTLASQITKYFKPLYIEMSKSERASIKGYLLNAYVQLGYNRADKSKDIDKWLD